MIFNTMSDAAEEIKKVVNGGSCGDPLAFSRINQATRRLLNRNKKPIHIRRLVRFYTRKDIITLPAEVEKILHYTMDTVPMPMFSQAYEFVSHGPGELPCNPCFTAAYLEDRGNHYSTMFDVPSYEEFCGCNRAITGSCADSGPVYTGQTLVALSTSVNDTTRSLKLVARNTKNEAMGEAGAGFELPIWAWDGGIEGQVHVTDLPLSEPVRDVTWVHKPVTDGFVSLYAYDANTFQFYFLAKYHPHETNPRYRRYRVTAPDCCCGHSILAWCELGYVPMNHGQDVLIIQNIDAIKMMVMAIEMENERDFQMAKAYEADAYRLIEEQRMSERTHDYNLIQVSHCYGFGGITRV
jgi:hypothetical protein